MGILRRFKAGKTGQKKRFWSDDEKRLIYAQTTVPGVSLAQVAHRYAMNANLIHNWLKDSRFAPEPEIAKPDYPVDFFQFRSNGQALESFRRPMLASNVGARVALVSITDPSSLIGMTTVENTALSKRTIKLY